MDGFIKKHRDGYGWASKLLVQLDGHTTLGTIVKEGDRLSIAPFSTLPREKAICILHRAFQRGGKRFSKAVKSSEATADIEVWTKAAWEKHHEIQSEAA